jgi:hypothetical protein
VLSFEPNAPARSYTIVTSAAAQTVQLAATARQPQAQVTIDPVAQVLPQLADRTLPQANAMPTISIPLVIR